MEKGLRKKYKGFEEKKINVSSIPLCKKNCDTNFFSKEKKKFFLLGFFLHFDFLFKTCITQQQHIYQSSLY